MPHRRPGHPDLRPRPHSQVVPLSFRRLQQAITSAHQLGQPCGSVDAAESPEPHNGSGPAVPGHTRPWWWNPLRIVPLGDHQDEPALVSWLAPECTEHGANGPTVRTEETQLLRYRLYECGCRVAVSTIGKRPWIMLPAVNEESARPASPAPSADLPLAAEVRYAQRT
jgi:hypothetical protein